MPSGLQEWAWDYLVRVVLSLPPEPGQDAAAETVGLEWMETSINWDYREVREWDFTTNGINERHFYTRPPLVCSRFYLKHHIVTN